MKKITIYTLADKRPDFIAVQHASFKKFIKDEYEFIVLNNAMGSRKRTEEIYRICEELHIKCIKVKKDRKFNIIGKQKSIGWTGTYTNPNVACAYPIKWAWEEMCEYNKDKLFMLIDSDMFIRRDISFSNEMEGYDAALWMQYRGLSEKRTKASVTYFTNGICIFDPSKIKNIKEMNWDCGIIKKAFVNGYAVDVGGYIYTWLKENNLKIKHVSEYAIYSYKIKENDIIWLECAQNGNYYYSFEYNRKDKTTSNYVCHEIGWQADDAIFPHFPPDFEGILKQKIIKYFEEFILDKQTYPLPTFLGFMEFETFNEKIDPFIIHIKAGSGYVGFDENYRKLKFDFVKKSLNI
jgi:hypothetical protein